MKIIEVTDINSKFLPEILKLLWDTQGENMCSMDYLKTCVTSADEILFASFEGEQLIGAAAAKVIDHFDYYLPFGEEHVQKMKANKVGSFATMSVHSQFQGKGYGQALSFKREEWLRSKGCSLLVGVSWASGLSHTSDRTFEKLGFKKMSTVENFYNDWSIANNLKCAVCKKPPCICGASLYMKEFNNAL